MMHDAPQVDNGLPEGWVWTTLGEVTNAQSGVGFPKAYQGRTEGSFPFAKVADISTAFKSNNGVLFTAANYLDEVEAEELRAKVFPVGSTMFAKIGEAVKLNRRALNFVPILADNNVMGLIPKPGVVASKLIYYFMMTVELGELSQATTVPSVRKSDIVQISVPLAPLPEQHRIVAEIETQFTRLDAGVAALKRVQANLRRYKASVLKAACEGRLVPTEAELASQEGRDYEPADVLLQRILAERRARWEAENPKKKYNEPAAPDTDGLPALPEGWVWATVEQLAAHEPNSITDGPFGSKLKTEHYLDEGPRVIRLQNIGDGVFNNEFAHISWDHFETLKRHSVFSGDLVIAALGASLPRSCIIPEYVGPAIVKADCIRFQPHPGLADASYLNSALNSDVTKKTAAAIVHGIGRPRLNQQEVKSLPIPLPPRAEQERITAEIERRLSVVHEVEATVAANLKRAERLRQSILKRAFEGRLVAQDPNDEPASALLGRIRLGL